MMEFLSKLRRELAEWNLFADEDENTNADGNHQLQIDQSMREQRLSTRIYVVLLNSECL